MALSVELVTNVQDLGATQLELWNDLAANPLQSWQWLGSWWEAYQRQYRLHILRVSENGSPIAFAPWCIQQRAITGRTIQFLGSGKACTDHLSLLVRPQDTRRVCDEITKWLKTADQHAIDRSYVWDAVELIGVDADDQPINCLAESMQAAGLGVQRTDGVGCYVIDLPATWDEYVKMRSKSGRREIRQSMKNIDSGKISVKTVGSEEELEEFWDLFVALHQRRRHASGTSGCFDHPPFGLFLRKAAKELLRSGWLKFVVATADDVPVAAQFAIVDDQTWYFYQSGMEPDAADLRPGLSVFCQAIRSTIESGRGRFDMMRGDEAYKLRWRAELHRAQEVRVCSPRITAQVRHRVYTAGVAVKNMIKSKMGIGQTQS